MASSEDLTSGFYDDEPTHCQWFSCFSPFFTLFGDYVAIANLCPHWQDFSFSTLQQRFTPG
jgi:nitrite reductase/ring-hydroxylating ferredoxin subunit